jgi:hypothetical protein
LGFVQVEGVAASPKNKGDVEMKPFVLPLIVAGITLGAGSARAAFWVENFDSYANGTVMSGVNGWSGWDNSAAAAGTVSTAQKVSAPNALALTTASDAIKEFAGVNSGTWVFETSLYLPGRVGGTFSFIMLNKYSAGGDKDWSVQLPFNLTTNKLTDDNVAGASLDIVRGWSNLRVEIDLISNSRSIYYNNQLLSTRAWTTGDNSLLAFQAIDLYGNSVGNTAYVDNMSLTQVVPEPASLAVLAIGALALIRRRRK